MPVSIAHIYRYPVKGMSPEPLDTVTLAPGEGLPQDRRFALAHGTTRFDPRAPEWLPKTHFLMLMRNERLARLRTRFDENQGTLTIWRGDRRVVEANITTPTGRALVEDFFAAFLGDEARGGPKLVEAEGHMFSDHRTKVVSAINLASLRDLERVTGRPVDHRRFRANLYVDGAPAWAESDWAGRDIRIGPARLRVTGAIDRCAATNVNPNTGERDMQIPLTLKRGFGHVEMGVYAQVIEGGDIRLGDTASIPGRSAARQAPDESPGRMT